MSNRRDVESCSEATPKPAQLVSRASGPGQLAKRTEWLRAVVTRAITVEEVADWLGDLAPADMATLAAFLREDGEPPMSLDECFDSVKEGGLS